MALSLSYGIGVKNRYALFMGDEDADPLELLAKSVSDQEAPSAKETSSSTTKKGSNAKRATQHSAQQSAPTSTDNKLGSKDTNANTAASNLSSTKNKTTPQAINKTSSSSSSIKTQKDNAANQQNTTTNASNGVNKRMGKDSTMTRQPLKDTSDGTKNYPNKGGDNRQRENRPPRQERIIRPSTNTSSSTGFGTVTSTQNDSSVQSGGFKDQKDFEERKNRRNREQGTSNFSSEFKDRGDEGFRGRGSRGGPRGGFRGRGRGRGGGNGFDGREKREYDRRSGSDKTGIKPVEKREGSGAHNWGTVTDELEAQMNPVMDETQDSAERSGDENAFESNENKDENATTEEETKEAEPTEEAAKEMTLDEWKQQEEEKRAVPKFNLRKPGEGEDANPLWKKSFILKKKTNDDDEDEYEEIIVEEEVRHGRPKKVIDIEINFGRDEARDTRRGRGRGGGPRGGRGGGGRGGRGAGPDAAPRTEGGGGGGRGGRGGFKRDARGGEQAAPKVDDWNDFPSLAAA